MGSTKKDIYSEHWDRYVTEDFPRIQKRGPVQHDSLEEWRVLNTSDSSFEWPGDEWGDRQDTERILEATLGRELDRKPQLLCEIGAGSGRYTVVALEKYGEARLVSFDVSEEFARCLRQRCATAVNDGRLETVHLGGDPRSMLRALEERNARRQVDAVYSFDALVHVDLHTLVVYLVTAARVLRVGGVLAVSVADASTERGFLKLLANAPVGYSLRGSAGAIFMWVSGDLVETILGRLGFEVRRYDGNGRDAFLSARLVDAAAAETWLSRSGVRW